MSNIFVRSKKRETLPSLAGANDNRHYLKTIISGLLFYHWNDDATNKDELETLKLLDPSRVRLHTILALASPTLAPASIQLGHRLPPPTERLYWEMAMSENTAQG